MSVSSSDIPEPFPAAAAAKGEATSKSAVPDIIHKVVALSLGSQDDPFRDDDIDHESSLQVLSEQLRSLNIKRQNTRFWGKSSGVMFMQTAISMNNDSNGALNTKRMSQNKIPMLWKSLPWIKESIRSTVEYNFPPPDLIKKLSDEYFENVNLFYPLLHRPTFERAIANDLHLHDQGFGSVLLLVCAVGSRYTETIDERALENVDDPHFLAGWKWYKQVQVVKPIILDPPTLCDLQLYCLAVEFLSRCSEPQILWVLVGFGIRLAQDVGAHRRRVPLERLTVEEELWKRAFWVLVARDRIFSMAIGRPCAVDDNQFDLDMPVECDDEYWEHPDPKQRFKQPKHVPSTAAYFTRCLRLTKILSFAMSTIYSIKTKFWKLILPEWEQHIVAELDSALNNWRGSLPEHLRWDPNRADGRFFKLSGYLMSMYHLVQILIHRPYIRANGQPPPLNFPSLAICTNAARSCTLVLEEQMKRFVVIHPYMQFCCITAGIVLLLNIWGTKRNGVVTDLKAMRQVEICIDVLRRAKDRSSCAGSIMFVLSSCFRDKAEYEIISLGIFLSNCQVLETLDVLRTVMTYQMIPFRCLRILTVRREPALRRTKAACRRAALRLDSLEPTLFHVYKTTNSTQVHTQRHLLFIYQVVLTPVYFTTFKDHYSAMIMICNTTNHT
ncbi:fungal-specific transcription factor domain-containing protein [Cyathus striatus]|nr:fungal-specific transcription factor domain-containing protein [Cyathus striatus]